MGKRGICTALEKIVKDELENEDDDFSIWSIHSHVFQNDWAISLSDRGAIFRKDSLDVQAKGENPKDYLIGKGSKLYSHG